MHFARAAIELISANVPWQWLRCDLWFPSYPLGVALRRIRLKKVIPQFRASTTSPSFPSYTLACIPCARSPALSLPASYFSRWPDSSTWDWIKPKYTCELLLRAASSSHSFPPRWCLTPQREKKLGRRGPPPKSKHQWSDSKEGISIGVSLSCASFIYSLLCSGVCNRCVNLNIL